MAGDDENNREQIAWCNSFGWLQSSKLGRSKGIYHSMWCGIRSLYTVNHTQPSVIFHSSQHDLRTQQEVASEKNRWNEDKCQRWAAPLIASDIQFLTTRTVNSSTRPVAWQQQQQQLFRLFRLLQIQRLLAQLWTRSCIFIGRTQGFKCLYLCCSLYRCESLYCELQHPVDQCSFI